MKRSMRRGFIGAIVAAGLSSVMVGSAAGYALDQDFGSPADSRSSFVREIDISPETNWVNVDQNEVIKFVDTSSGKSFYWRFDTGNRMVKLENIAPAGSLAGKRNDAYVSDPGPQD